ncbi:MAG: rRNA cytosine-C5-methyltransferase [Prevotellaceae bacterium]|nr:rRNA cytosine-C5-methyltransferase [Prevotellaceae bacterium]
MAPPSAFVQQIQSMLGSDYACFLDSLHAETPISIRYNRKKATIASSDNTVPWCRSAVYLSQRPVFTLDPLFHGGVYYVQEAASMFIEQVIGQLQLNKPVRALDLCAAPGGKSTHLLDCLIEGSLLVSNEVIRNRVNILTENLCKWGQANVVVSHNEPKDFVSLPSFFDLLLIDAPCSGEGMFRKDPTAIKEWSKSNVKLCTERQRRILAEVWDTLKEEGYLLYSTCTYNREENEENVQWIINQLGAKLLRIPLQPEWNITESNCGYRFFPYKTKSEGFFISILQKNSAAPQAKRQKISAINMVKKNSKWLEGDFTIVRQDDFVQAWPTTYVDDISILKQQLRVVQAGIPTGEIKGKDIVPHTAVALSTALHSDAFPQEALNLEDALHFLRRDTIKLQSQLSGYHVVSYEGHPLGFVKNLRNRCNNLYPNNWRIRMAMNNE